MPINRKGPLPYLFAHGVGGGSESTSAVSIIWKRGVPLALGVGRICGGDLGIRLGSRRMQVFLIV
jgi:hypothetical protein